MTDRGRTDFLLASMRAAASNLRTWQLEIEFIGVGLKNGIVTYEAAVEQLDQLGLLQYLPGTQAAAVSLRGKQTVSSEGHT